MGCCGGEVGGEGKGYGMGVPHPARLPTRGIVHLDNYSRPGVGRWMGVDPPAPPPTLPIPSPQHPIHDYLIQ